MVAKFNGQVWAGIAWLLGSAFFLSVSLSYPYMNGDKPGAGFFPVWLSGLMVLFSILHIINSVRKNEKSKEILPRGAVLKNILIVFGSMILFILVAPYFGFNITCTLFLAGLFYFNGYKWYYCLAAGLVSSIILFLLFYSFLGVAFPVNDFGW